MVLEQELTLSGQEPLLSCPFFSCLTLVLGTWQTIHESLLPASLPGSTRPPHWGGTRPHAIWGLAFLPSSAPRSLSPAHLLFHQERRSRSAGCALLRAAIQGVGRSRRLPGSTVPSILAPPRLGLPRRTEFTARLTAGHCTPCPTRRFPVVMGTVCPSGMESSPNSLPHRQEGGALHSSFSERRGGDPGSQPISARACYAKGDRSSCLSGLVLASERKTPHMGLPETTILTHQCRSRDSVQRLRAQLRGLHQLMDLEMLGRFPHTCASVLITQNGIKIPTRQ